MMYDSLASLIQQSKEELGMFDEVDAVRTVLLPDAEEVRKGVIVGAMYAAEKPDKFFDDLVVEYKAKHAPSTTEASGSGTKGEGSTTASEVDVSRILSKMDDLGTILLATFNERMERIEAAMQELRREVRGKKRGEDEVTHSQDRHGTYGEETEDVELQSKEVRCSICNVSIPNRHV